MRYVISDKMTKNTFGPLNATSSFSPGTIVMAPCDCISLQILEQSSKIQ